MSKYLQIAKDYHRSGLTIVPFNSDKKCLVSWKKFQTTQPTIEEVDQMFSKQGIEYIALICGNGIEAIDIDAKHNLDGQDISKEYGEHLKFFAGGEKLLGSLLIESTKNNGYHFIYKCEKVGKNDKLAYNANNEVLIETRGEGGLLFIAPSVGYSVKRGSFLDIPVISVDQRDLLMNVARSFNFRGVKEKETKEEVKVRAEIIESKTTSSVVWSWDDYNSKDDCLNVLKDSGWLELPNLNSRNWIYFNRPHAKNKSNVDAAWNIAEKYFYVFTSSDSFFEDEKGYSPTSIYSTLKCNGDYKETCRELYKKGHGTHEVNNTKQEKEVKLTEKEVEHRNKILDFVESTRFDRHAKVVEDDACLYATIDERKYKIGGFGMLGCIVGMQKSGKSLVSTCITGSALSSGSTKLNFNLDLEGKSMQFYDTEQSKYFYGLTQNRIFDIANEPDNVKYYDAYHLRRLSKKDRLEAIRYFIYQCETLGVVIIDGIVDLIKDYNDLKESQYVVDCLLKWADEKNILILVILHLTKTSGSMRGHLGTELQNKCDFTLEVKNDKESGNYTVLARESRFKPFPKFEFQRSEDGMPTIDGIRVDGKIDPVKDITPIYLQELSKRENESEELFNKEVDTYQEPTQDSPTGIINRSNRGNDEDIPF